MIWPSGAGAGIRDVLRKCGAITRNHRSLSTWSPLATAFNSRPQQKQNFTKNECGLFSIPELTNFEGFYALKKNAMIKTDQLVAEACGEQRSRKMVEVFDELSDTLCKVADMAEFVRLAHPARKFSEAAEDACISVSGIVEKLNTDRELFQALKRVVDHGDKMETTEIDRHVSQLFLFDFEQCGIHLEEKQRQRVVYLTDCILQLGQRFMSGAVNPRSVDKNTLPESIRQFFSISGNQILISSLYADSSNAMAREAAYRLYLYPDRRQEELLKDILACRHELAQLCGFPTYAHRALKSSTVETPAMVGDFLARLSAELRPRAAKDFAAMQEMKHRDTMLRRDLNAWDTPYYTAKLKRDWLQVSSAEFAPYFSLGACMQGLNLLMTKLYGVRLESVEMGPGESWHRDTHKLAVVDEAEGLLGYIYCDFFERPEKPSQDCHFTIQGGKRLSSGEYQTPVVVIMLNMAQARNGPTLLTPAMVDNLFHEMGHAMHSMLARTEYQHVTGTRCSTDFAEIPSILMEYFASDPRVVAKFARHYRTQEAMPEAMLQRLCASKNLFSASETQLQVFYSALDQAYHSRDVSGGSTTDVLRELQEKYYGLPYVENTAWQLRFSHLIGYGAKYYSYLVSRAIASGIWQKYFEEDPFSRRNGERYRREFLAFGGGVPSRQLVANFLGSDVSAEQMTSSLINEIDRSTETIEKLR